MRATSQKRGFTIVELLTVMSIIIILMGVLVPAVNKTRIFAKTVTQRAQFHEISRGLELFRNDHEEAYPDSSAVDSNASPAGYCGAMRLCEALIGQDGMGFHPSSSNFQAKQTDAYPFDLCKQKTADDVAGNTTLAASLRERIKYTEAESVSAVRLQDIYNWDITSGTSYYAGIAFKNGDGYPNAVIFDVFRRATIQSTRCPDRGSQKVGMPVLYYKADSSKLAHDATTAPDPSKSNTNIYNFDDNYAITALGCPWETSPPPPSGTGTPHPMQTDPRVFLNAITNSKATATPRPHNEGTYILLSAGYDGLYGTTDDVYNFID
ncbi:MAG: type II secretion system protein [Sedimentisphaerales bacterium]|jgi:type II secretory pathway pseudopilin PulG